MTAPAVFYVPLLHHDCVPARVRDRVVCVPCGLPEPCSPRTGRAGLEAREAIRRLLPLGPAESLAALEELLRLGEEHAPSGILRQLSALRLMDDASREALGEEMAALGAFSASGRAPSGFAGKNGKGLDGEKERLAQDDPLPRQALVNSQKILLLAHALEERLLEVTRLENRFSRAEDSLRAALGEGGAGDLPDFGPPDAPQSGDEAEPVTLPVSWRLVVEAMFSFLPDKAVLFTEDAAMVQDLLAADLLRPLSSEDRAGLLPAWPEDFAAGLLYARLPAWRLAGRRARQAERPWLDKEYEVLAAEPAGGFSA